jgi:hypothetical protein
MSERDWFLLLATAGLFFLVFLLALASLQPRVVV